MKVLLFGGTSEGRTFAAWLLSQGIPTTVCVATHYGGTLLPQGVECRVGRLDQAQMVDLMGQGYTHVVDATHPYAALVSRYIQGACQESGAHYLRLLREGPPEGDWHHVQDLSQAAQLAQTLPGQILLTTGSKELEPFATETLRARTYPRVLPTVDSLQRCLDLGFPVGHILCMQGPFSQKLNEALLEQFHIGVMVTKASGGAGGFWEKVAAAQTCDVALIVVDRPTEETGYTLKELKNIGIFTQGESCDGK